MVDGFQSARWFGWSRPRFGRVIAALVAFVALGCEPSGPPTVHTTSEGMGPDARVELLERYVRFRRPYEQLDFALDYRNNSGGLVAGSSEWDIRIVAVVPEASLEAWTGTEAPTGATPDTSWAAGVPTDVEVTGVDEWYVEAGVTTGLDRANRVVVYRAIAR